MGSRATKATQQMRSSPRMRCNREAQAPWTAVVCQQKRLGTCCVSQEEACHGRGGVFESTCSCSLTESS